MTKNKVLVSEQALASRIFNKGYFGSFKDGKLELSLYEALYLKEKKELKVTNIKGKALTTRNFIMSAEKAEKGFWIKYCVFRDMREAGYILKTAFKYGGDFRVYEKGHKPGDEHAAWIVYALGEHDELYMSAFSSINRIAHSVKKKVIIATVDDEDSVTYYETRWLKI